VRSVTSKTRTYSLLGVHEVQTWCRMEAKNLSHHYRLARHRPEASHLSQKKSSFWGHQVGDSRRDHRGSDASLEKSGKPQLARGITGSLRAMRQEGFQSRLRNSSQKQEALASTEKKLQRCTEHFVLVLAN